MDGLLKHYIDLMNFSNNPVNTAKKKSQSFRPKHGGRLADAVQRYGIKKNAWLDLSTGINPKSWPVPTIPEYVWRCLPDNDELLNVAAEYYASETLQVTAGSQQSIELLPQLLGNNLRIGVIAPTYAEHAYAWQKNGHQVIVLSVDEVEKNLPSLDGLIIVNPNNPGGYQFTVDDLLHFQDYFIQHNNSGFLLVDEAFMDCTPEFSIIPYVERGNLIVLRSIGKFFGLAGIRCGFIFAQSPLLAKLSEAMMPWSVSHPARWIVTQALADKTWIAENKIYLAKQSQQVNTILQKLVGESVTGCSLFQTVYHQNADKIFQLLAQQAVLVRLLDNQKGLRFGLPRDLNGMNKLTNAMKVAFN